MACPDPETLVCFVDGELDAAQRAAAARHVAGCASCRTFVEEIDSLNALGRSSLRTIAVPSAGDLRRVPQPRKAPRVFPLAALAGAAVIVLVVTIARWLAMNRIDAPAPPAPVKVAEAPAPAPLADDAFERWAAPYRQNRIPLVPMEQVATYEPPEVLPAGPAAPEVKLKS